MSTNIDTQTHIEVLSQMVQVLTKDMSEADRISLSRQCFGQVAIRKFESHSFPRMNLNISRNRSN